ncbi:MAG: sulfurtransferase TusA family protein [Rhodospirillales bacterium]
MTEKELDCRGLSCPLPVLKSTKAMKSLNAGDRLVVLATDPASYIDIPHFCQAQGHKLEEWTESDGVYTYRIIKGAA